MKKTIAILIILFGIFATACGGFWEISLINLLFPIQSLIYFMPILSILIGGGIIWLAGRKIDFSWITKGWRIFFIILFILAGVFQIFLMFLLFSI